MDVWTVCDEDGEDAARGREVREVDPQQVRAAASGDLDAFTDLVRVHQEAVWRFLWQLTGDRTLAEDLAQETFLRAFDRLPTFRFEARFSTWLYRIARNSAMDAMRRRDRLRALPDRLGGQDAAPGPELGTEMTAALASISEELREALVLVEIGGLTCREAAETLGIPEGTVKSRLFHARKRLVAWFSADGADDGGEQAHDA
jgi:RNA polymerase sigma-70 factor (ECF subfamily)